MDQRSREFRVAEIFGPTIQGEGRNVGMPCHFVRFGGCDFRCSWCDSPHAVLPELVAQLPKKSVYQIVTEVVALGFPTQSEVKWVVLTGGNPGLLNLDELVTRLHRGGFQVMVETQGSTYQPWYTEVDDLCFSPKPPSSGKTSDLDLLGRIVDCLYDDMQKTIKADLPWVSKRPYLKVPIFLPEDLDYAEEVHTMFPSLELFLSIGNNDPSLPTVGNPNPELTDAAVEYTRDIVLDNFKRITEEVLLTRPLLHDCRIFPQQHTLLWGNERGH